jgi:ribose transport system substrate-binding protein
MKTDAMKLKKLTRREAVRWIAGAVGAAGAAASGAFALPGCNKGDTAAGGSKKLRIAFVTNNSAPFWTYARAGCRKAEQETPGVTVDFQIPSDRSAPGQKRIIDDLLTRGIDGIAISPVDPVNQTPMLNEVAKQVMVFTQDSDAPNSDRTCYVGTDNVAAGKQAGELIKQVLPDGGKIMLFVGKKDAQNARERFDGIKQALAGTKIEILDLRTDDADEIRAKANAQDTLVKYPDLAGMVGLWEYNGPAILSAVREAGKAGKVKIVTFDAAEETLNGVRSGDIYGTIVQQPFEFGRLAVEIMAKALRGDRSEIPPGKQKFIPTKAILKNNVDAYQAELKQFAEQK